MDSLCTLLIFRKSVNSPNFVNLNTIRSVIRKSDCCFHYLPDMCMKFIKSFLPVQSCHSDNITNQRACHIKKGNEAYAFYNV